MRATCIYFHTSMFFDFSIYSMYNEVARARKPLRNERMNWLGSAKLVRSSPLEDEFLIASGNVTCNILL